MSNMTRRDFLKVSALVGGSLMAPAAVSALAEEKPLKVRAAVFSPTGGTMNAAYLLAAQLSDAPEMIDITPLAARNETITFAADELAIMAAPSYAGKIPYAPNLFTNLKGSNTPCVIVAAFGNRACENNFAQMNRIATENGFVVIGAIALVTPHVFAARAGHSRPDVADLAPIKAFAEGVLAKIKAGNVAPITVEGDPADSTKFAIAVEKPFDAEKCIKCGLCMQNCSVGAIGADLTIDEDKCISCLRCAHVCPTAARSYLYNWDAADSKYLSPKKEVSYVL